MLRLSSVRYFSCGETSKCVIRFNVEWCVQQTVRTHEVNQYRRVRDAIMLEDESDTDGGRGAGAIAVAVQTLEAADQQWEFKVVFV